MASFDLWYQKLADMYGEDFCRIAGFFDETTPFGKTYGEIFDLPEDEIIIQFSGAFHPFHEGHLSIVKQAVNYVSGLHSDMAMGINVMPHVVIHADHSEYRYSKGQYDEDDFLKSFDILNGHKFTWTLIQEDSMPDGCSRNFTRLYYELMKRNAMTYFLSGGDRANYALSFVDNGNCIIAGRSQHSMYMKYENSFLRNINRIQFLPGNHPASSTEIRKNKK